MSRNVPAPAGAPLGFTSASPRLTLGCSPALSRGEVESSDGHGYEGPLAGVAGHLCRQSRATLQAEYDAVDAVLDAAFEDVPSTPYWTPRLWPLRGR